MPSQGMYISATALSISLLTSFVLFSILYKKGKYASVLLIALAARIVLIALHEKYRVLGDEDIGDYQHYLVEFANIYSYPELLSYISFHAEFYVILFSGWLYRLLGEESFYVIRISNSILSILAIIVLNYIYEVITDSEFNRWQLIMLLFWPSYVRFSVSIGRTITSLLFVILSIALLVKYVNTLEIRYIIGFVFLSAPVFMIRVHYLSYPVFSYFMVIVYNLYRRRYSQKQILYILLICFIFLTSSFALYQLFVPSYHQIGSLEDLVAIAQTRERGGSVYLAGIYPSHFLDLVWYLPLHGFYFLFSPMPWSIHNILALVASIESSILFIISMIIMKKSSFTDIKNINIFVITGCVILTSVGFGAVTKNAGGAMRWRLPSVILLLLLFVIIIHRRHPLETDE